MKFVKYIKSLNLFQPQKSEKLQEIKINLNETIIALNDDNSIYGLCSVIENQPILFKNSLKTHYYLIKEKLCLTK
jgi:hypothetical protein